MAKGTSKVTEETREKPVKGTRPGRNGGTLNSGGGGRPKGSVSITKHLREALEAQDEKQAKNLALAIIQQAINGNGVAMKAVLDRIDGPVTEKIDGTLSVRVEFGDDPSAGHAPGPSEG